MFALPRWDGPYFSTALSMAKELSRTHRVFYVDNPFTVKDMITGLFTKPVRIRMMAFFFGLDKYRRIDPDNPNLINVTPHPTLPANFLPAGRVHRFLSRINNAIVRRAIASAIRDHRINDFIYINSFNPFYFPNLDAFRPLCKIYHCVDNIAASKYYTAKHGRSLEKEMIRNFDLTLTTSQRLSEYARQLSNHVFYLPNAADFKLFQHARETAIGRPREIEQVDQKIIGYIGHVDHRMDYDLLTDIATHHPEYVLLLVGPTGSNFERSRLEELPNVITTGSKRLTELPAYVRFMDCGIIPFLCNALTESIYPLKLNEYLAAAKPVVTTNFSPDLNEFEDVIKIARTKKEFVASLSDELRTDSAEKQSGRVKKASGNTWEARVSEFWKIVDPYCRKAS